MFFPTGAEEMGNMSVIQTGEPEFELQTYIKGRHSGEELSSKRLSFQKVQVSKSLDSMTSQPTLLKSSSFSEKPYLKLR